MSGVKRLAALCLPLFFLAGCVSYWYPHYSTEPVPVTVETPKPEVAPPPPSVSFVLLADREGKVGSIRIVNANGEVVLNRERESVKVVGAAKPGQTTILTEEELSRDFKEALNALPLPTAKFILYFETGSDKLTRESEAQIPRLIAAIRDRAEADVSIAGHADTVGSAKVNERISLERAKAVAAIIKEAGMDVSSFQVTSHGQNNPLIKTPDNVDEPRNRRVEVTIR